MRRTLLASTSLALALLFVPIGTPGPFSPTGAAGISPAKAEFGIELGLGAGDDDDGPSIGFGIGGGGDDDDDEGDDDDDE